MALQFLCTFILIFMVALFSGVSCEVFNYEKVVIVWHKRALFIIGFLIGISAIAAVWGL